MEYDLITLGEMLMRLSPPVFKHSAQSGVFEYFFGGAEMNVAAAAAQLGRKTAFLTKLPGHMLGQLARRALKTAGIGERYVLDDCEKNIRLGLYYYVPADFPSVPQVVYDRECTSMRTMTLGELEPDIFSDASCFHVSGITLGLGGSCGETAIEAIKNFKAAGALISFDVNYRMNLWSGEEARRCIETILPMVDIFFCSEDTMRLTFKKEGCLKEMMASFADAYPMKAVVSTQRIVHRPSCHSFGSTVLDCHTGRFYEDAGYERIEITDRIGSGDAYVGGFLSGILQEGVRDNILSQTLKKAMDIGNACAALKMTQRGDMIVAGPEEIEDIIQRHYEGCSYEMKR